MNNHSAKTRTITGMAVLTAIVVVLQWLASILPPFGTFHINLVLTPIIVGAALYGAWAGGWLGFVFGVVVLLTDAGAFLAVDVVGTIVTCILKGVLSGLAAGLVFRLCAKKSVLLATILGGICAAVVNTGVFLLGCCVFFYDTVAAWGAAVGFENTATYMLVGFVGVNFLGELGVNLVLSSATTRIVTLRQKSEGGVSCAAGH